jgi:hypothetical protein
MEPEVSFDITGVTKGPAAEFKRLAVLEPLYGPASGDDQIVKNTIEVVELWRDRIKELARAGLPEFVGVPAKAGRRAAQKAKEKADELRAKAASCPPGFVRQTTESQPCRLWWACPFCWARAWVPYWRMWDQAFRADPATVRDTRRLLTPDRADDPSLSPVARAAIVAAIATVRDPRCKRGMKFLPHPEGYDLLEWHAAYDFPFHDRDPKQGYQREALPWWVRSLEEVQRDLFDHAWGVPAKFDAPVVTIGNGMWHVEHTRLLMVPEGSGVPLYWQHVVKDGEYELHPRPSRPVVTEAFARAFQYPVEVLTHKYPKEVVYLLTRAYRNTHLFGGRMSVRPPRRKRTLGSVRSSSNGRQKGTNDLDHLD